MLFEGVYGNKELGGVAGSGDGRVLRVGGAVTVTHQPAGQPNGPQHDQLVLEWEGGALADTIADAIVTVILQVRGSIPCKTRGILHVFLIFPSQLQLGSG